MAMMKLSRKLLLVWVMALSLLGVQLIQHSALHDHSQHVVDCALCHFDSHDHVLPVLSEINLAEPGIAEQIHTPQTHYLSKNHTPYQGRSPPHFLI